MELADSSPLEDPATYDQTFIAPAYPWDYSRTAYSAVDKRTTDSLETANLTSIMYLYMG